MNNWLFVLHTNRRCSYPCLMSVQISVIACKVLPKPLNNAEWDSASIGHLYKKDWVLYISSAKMQPQPVLLVPIKQLYMNWTPEPHWEVNATILCECIGYAPTFLLMRLQDAYMDITRERSLGHLHKIVLLVVTLYLLRCGSTTTGTWGSPLIIAIKQVKLEHIFQIL